MEDFKIRMTTKELGDLSWSLFWAETDKLGLDGDSCALLEWRLEEEIGERFVQLLNYFGERPDDLGDEIHCILAELSLQEWRWCREEKFEWCCVIRDIQFKFLEEWADLL